MEYFVSFLEGVITFVSPCLLPMIPIYVTYFAAGEEQSTRTILKNALGFVLGFTIVFVCMGALAGTIGSFFLQYRIVLNIICGLVVIFFGLYFLGFIKINWGSSQRCCSASCSRSAGRHAWARFSAQRSCWHLNKHRW